MSHAESDAGVRCMMMRGGTSKGVFLLADDIPAGTAERDALLLRLMGSPDPRQIDGLGGAHPLTSKVAVVRPSQRADADVDYLFLQVFVDEPLVSDRQNCGNMLAGVGPFAIERGLVETDGETTVVRIHMVNTGELAVATVCTADGRVEYEGNVEIPGVPGTASPVVINFPVMGDTPMLPTGSVNEVIDDVRLTCVDVGMPVVVIRAEDLGITCRESCEELEADTSLRERLEAIRRTAAARMGLGDVTAASIPKLSLLAPAAHGGAVASRTFIPHRCHAAIGVLGGAGVAVACALPGSAVHDLVNRQADGAAYRIEHPTGYLDVDVEIEKPDGTYAVRRIGVVRTARKLFDGLAYAG